MTRSRFRVEHAGIQNARTDSRPARRRAGRSMRRVRPRRGRARCACNNLRNLLRPYMSSNVKVAVAQINCSVGDFEGNSRKIVEAAARAVAEGAHVMVTPELSLTGYPPEDLLLRRAFYAACDSALQRLAVQLVQYPDLAVVVGHPLAREGLRFNAASVLQGGVVVGTYCKHDLPNYDVFDEQRYFTPDNRPFVFEARGTLFGVN